MRVFTRHEIQNWLPVFSGNGAYSQEDGLSMTRGNLGWLLGVFAVTLFGISLSISAPSFNDNFDEKHKNINLVIDVMEEVQDKYVRSLDTKQMRGFVENMINGGLQQLDPHSAYINEEEFNQFQKLSQGRFGGIGIRITAEPKSGAIIVESPMVGTPAYKAGVLAGDLITKIDGTSTENMMLNDVVKRIQGEPGEPVTLTVVHEGSSEEKDIKIVRAEIKIDSVMGDLPLEDNDKHWEYMIDKTNKIAYVRINAFTETTVEELTKVVEDLQKQGMKGLILDLRNNPGGLLRSAVEVSSMFLEQGQRVVSTKGRNQQEEVYNARPTNGFTPNTTTPVAILINRYSASASEILAAALKDHLRAVIVGERSYGKGSVQNVIRLEGGHSALKLTTASYWRPNKHNIHRFPGDKESDEWGVKPTKGFEVKLTLQERLEYYKYRRERDVVGSQQNEGEKDKDKKAEPYTDPVLGKAMEYINEAIKKGNLAIPADANAGMRPVEPGNANLRQPPRGTGAFAPEALPKRRLLAGA